MSSPGPHSKDAAADLSRRIADAEMRSTAVADRLAALTMTEAEAEAMEAQQRLWEEMDALLTLRRQLWELRSSEGA